MYKMGIIKIVKKEFILSIFVILLIILSIVYHHQIINYPYFIDWRTIIALTGLLIITTGLKESKFFDTLSEKIIKKMGTEKSLSFFLIIFSALLSTFLTNDITLFVVIPLTIGIQNIIENDISKLIIFETISVNIGSSLTPIGNPQNIFLWHKWNISFITFIIKMFPLVIFLLLILLIFAWIVFSDKKIKVSEDISNSKAFKKPLLILSTAMLLVYIIFLELRLAIWILPVIFTIYIIYNSKVLAKVDWALLLLFIIIFIDFHIISTASIVSKTINALNLNSANNVFLVSVFTSQVVSNVPATVLISKFTHNWQVITYGVNVGGNGLIISSLANIIALRIAKNKKLWLSFHQYSIPYFLLTEGIIYGFIVYFKVLS